MLLIDEGGLLFEVDFASRLDCGIFGSPQIHVQKFVTHEKGRTLLRASSVSLPTGGRYRYAADGENFTPQPLTFSKPSLEWA